MDNRRQAELMIGAIEDYRRDLMSLNALIGSLEELIDAMADRSFKAAVDEPMFALVQADGARANGSAWFATGGKQLIEHALDNILEKTRERYPLGIADDEETTTH
jgi:Mg2+ and Co2+ transporter CorA